MIEVLISNTYECGRTSSNRVDVRPPDGELDDWWDEVVHPLTGDGHPCGASEHALYEALVVAAPGRPDLVGATQTWEG